MEYVLYFSDNDGMAGVCAPLVPCYNIDRFAEMVDNFPFSFIAPLGTNDDLNRHTDPIKEKLRYCEAPEPVNKFSL